MTPNEKDAPNLEKAFGGAGSNPDLDLLQAKTIQRAENEVSSATAQCEL